MDPVHAPHASHCVGKRPRVTRVRLRHHPNTARWPARAANSVLRDRKHIHAALRPSEAATCWLPTEPDPWGTGEAAKGCGNVLEHTQTGSQRSHNATLAQRGTRHRWEHQCASSWLIGGPGSSCKLACRPKHARAASRQSHGVRGDALCFRCLCSV
jgi:hypothetical protein